jgi:monoamine oxidase
LATKDDSPILVVGAGLAGLAAAVTLKRHGHRVMVLEKSRHVGGRVHTRKSPDGYLLDEGFQVLLTAYPEISRFCQMSELHLGHFASGARIYDGKSMHLLANPLKHPEAVLGAMSSTLLTWKDRVNLVRLAVRAKKYRVDKALEKQTTAAFLKSFGFSEGFVADFWRPFLAGVYLDSDLSLPADFFCFLVHCFMSGEVSLPANGMEGFASEIASRLSPKEILLDHSVSRVSANEVVLEDGRRLAAKNVVVSVPLGLGGFSTTYRGTLTHYFRVKSGKVPWGKWLVLASPRAGVAWNHGALLTAVQPTYGTGLPALLSVSSVFPQNPSWSQVREQIRRMPFVSADLEHVSTASVQHALPVGLAKGDGFEVRDGVVYCGDRYTTPSIQGALRSGRLAAEHLA